MGLPQALRLIDVGLPDANSPRGYLDGVALELPHTSVGKLSAQDTRV